MMTEEVKVELSEKVKTELDQWLTKYPQEERQSGVMYALRIAQEENGGWLTKDIMNAVADYLDMPQIAVYEVATFYNMYDLEPVGRHKINVCNSISCYLCDSPKILSHLKNKLNINPGETTQDGRFTLKVVECLAACSKAPAMQIDTDYHENLTEEKVDQILEEYK